MAEANTKAASITNLDASPRVLNAKIVFDGAVHEQVSTLEIAAADDTASVYRLGRVHSSWRISELTLFNDAITSGADFDMGLHRTAEDGGAAVDANAYSDAVTLVSGSLTGVQHLFESGGAKGVEEIEQAVWQDAGYSSDPGYWLDVTLTAATPGSGAGTVSARIRYVKP